MESNEHEPVSDEQLSTLLRKWDTGGAPQGLEARVWAERRSSFAHRNKWVLIPAAVSGLAVAASVGAWLMRPMPQLPRVETVVQVSPVQSVPVAESRPSADIPPPPPQGQAQQSSGRRESVEGDLYFNPGKASPFDAKPVPEPFPQDARDNRVEAPLPRGVFRVGNGVSAPSVAQKKEPDYSEEARIAKLSGTTLLQIVVGEDGAGRNFNVIRPLGLGLDERAVEAVRAWSFKPGMKDGAAVPVLASIEINFRLLDTPATPPWRLTRALFNPPAGAGRPVLTAAPYPPDAGSPENDSVRVSFDVDENGVPINFRGQNKTNPKLENEAIAILSGWRFQPGMKDGKPVTVPASFDFAHVNLEASASAASPQTAIRIGGEIAAGNLIDKTVPAYPKEAKAARLQGVVTLAVRIGRDGHVTNATVVSGDPILAQAALEAVRQWLYRPTLLNGNPVEVDTQVDVNFTLAK